MRMETGTDHGIASFKATALGQTYLFAESAPRVLSRRELGQFDADALNVIA